VHTIKVPLATGQRSIQTEHQIKTTKPLNTYTTTNVQRTFITN